MSDPFDLTPSSPPKHSSKPTSPSFWQSVVFLKLFLILGVTLVTIEIALYFVVTHFITQFIFFIAAGLIASLIILGIFGYFIFSPMFHLINKLNAFDQDHRHPEQYLTLPRYHNELNTLVTRVNELLRKLGDAQRNIKAHEAILELRVEERTKELSQLANYDVITELPNRNLLKECISQAMTEAEQEQKLAIVLILELLDFHEITNALGHSVGNLLLKEIAKYLTDNLPGQTVIAHISTTRFALTRNKLHNAAQITSLAQWILDLFTKPLSVANNSICTTINIGVAIYPNDGKDPESLIVNANLALNRAKANTPNSFQFYESGMNTRIEARRSTLVDLHYALDRNQIKVFYQPQVELKTKKIVGAEALIRWDHPEKGLISPSLFVPLAEESGLIISIGEWVLQTVCRQIKTWQQLGFSAFCIAVNLSSLQFRQKGFIDSVHNIIIDSGIPPEYLELEITESAIMQNIESAIATMKALHALGTPLALDDFGTGYSSLSYVKRFPLQKLKIDQSFVREIEEKPEEAHLAAIIIQLGKSMNLRTIAEGIETQKQADYLTEKGCDEGQGYLFGRPMTAEDFIELYKKSNDS